MLAVHRLLIMELRVGNRYRLGRKIGSGSFGDIYLGKLYLKKLAVLLPFVFFIYLRVVHEAVRLCQLVAFPGFPLRAESQSAVQCLVLATLATKLTVCVAKWLAARRLLPCSN